MGDLAKLRGLTAQDLRVLSLALALLPAVAFTLRCRGLRGVRRLIDGDRSTRYPSRDRTAFLRASHLARLFSIAARRGPFRSTCLVRSLALQWLLRVHGLGSELRLGVRKAGSLLDAHAWVEYAGTPISEPGPVSGPYAAFDHLEPDIER